MKRYKWGILGPGRIAEKFAEGLKLCDNGVLWSVGSRDKLRAEAFAQKFGFARSFGSYEEMVADPELDVVYIATPHSHHNQQTLLCLNSGKHVLCEKAFALNLREVEEMVSLAKSKSLFLMEALWPPFQPSYRKADEVIRSGELGRVMTIAGRFGFVSPYDPASRVYDLALGGGSLLDIGIYPVMDILRYMGIPSGISAVASFAPTGADDSLLAVLDYGNERRATAYSSFIEDAGIGTTIVLEKGKIILERNHEKVQFMTVEREGGETETYRVKPEASGFNLEALEVMTCLDQGRTESSVVPHSFSLDLMKLLDAIRNAAGISYPGRDI